jgi:hypothetical protein
MPVKHQLEQDGKILEDGLPAQCVLSGKGGVTDFTFEFSLARVALQLLAMIYCITSNYIPTPDVLKDLPLF